MKTLVTALFVATLSTGAFASEATHNGQHIRDIAVKAQQINTTSFGTSQGLAQTNAASVVGADRGANSGQ